jgi:hypothetical protein
MMDEILIYFSIIGLRPVDEFRHTPLIPISEKDLAEHRKKIDERNRRGYYVEIKKDTLYFYSKINIQNLISFFSNLFYSFRYYWLCVFDDE